MPPVDPEAEAATDQDVLMLLSLSGRAKRKVRLGLVAHLQSSLSRLLRFIRCLRRRVTRPLAIGAEGRWQATVGAA
jgi:hypothetical protein